MRAFFVRTSQIPLPGRGVQRGDLTFVWEEAAKGAGAPFFRLLLRGAACKRGGFLI